MAAKRDWGRGTVSKTVSGEESGSIRAEISHAGLGRSKKREAAKGGHPAADVAGYKEKDPEGNQYSQFCENYQRWKKNWVEPSKHIEHKGGVQMHVDYAGRKMPITNQGTGEIS